MCTVRPTLAAAVTVAILGGLVIPVAAQQGAAAADLLPGVGLVTEEVEPGVFRVLGDGVRELTFPVELESLGSLGGPPGSGYWDAAGRTQLVASEAGVWLGRPDGISRLGEEGFVRAAEPGRVSYPIPFEAAPDGTLYQRHGGHILDAGQWRRPPLPRSRGATVRAPEMILFAPDGSLWVEGTNGKSQGAMRIRLARRGADGWSGVEAPPDPRPRKTPRPPDVNDWDATADGVLYVTRASRDVQRFDGTRWETLQRPGGRIVDLHVGADGTVWLESWGQDRGSGIERLDSDGMRWTTHDVGIRHAAPTSWDRGSGQRTTVGPDGAIWYAPGDGDKETGRCDGVARYDGSTTTRFLRDLCIYQIAFGPGGVAWILAGDWVGSIWDPDEVGPIGVYAVPADAAGDAG